MVARTNIREIVIVGGGTAGWMTAAALAKVLGSEELRIRLVESESIGTIGVGEATIPQIGIFNNVLGFNEDQFVKATQATFKLGIEFVNWGAIGERYVHPFSRYGTNIDNVQFYHFWQKAYRLGLSPDLDAYSLNILACQQSKFMRPVNVENSPLANIAYAFHFDAALYAKFLRKYGENLGVQRIEGKVVDVRLNSENGFIDSVHLESGEALQADFFIDCSGFRGLLIEEALHSGYEDWSNFLPCDSAIAVPCERVSPAVPFTRATAHTAGWQWRIPLQHRTGNGHVFSSRFMSDQDAEQILLQNLDGEPLAQPRVIRFRTGKRKKIWIKNCLAVGLSSGFLEPLESTSIHLVQSTISKFLGMFPTKECHAVEVDKFNQQADEEYLGIRDFLILHYNATRRSDSEFWNYCREMDVPNSLKAKLELYRSCSRMYRENNELFDETSWLAVLHGQGVKAEGYSPLVDKLSLEELDRRLTGIRQVISKCANTMPSHEDFIAKHCKAQPL